MPYGSISGLLGLQFVLIRLVRCIDEHMTGQDGLRSTGVYDISDRCVVDDHWYGGSLRHLQGLRVAEHLPIYPVYILAPRLDGQSAATGQFHLS